jgi:hypothetical protein
VRGGTFNNDGHNVHAACRSDNDPGNRNRNIGCRQVLDQPWMVRNLAGRRADVTEVIHARRGQNPAAGALEGADYRYNCRTRDFELLRRRAPPQRL